MHSVKFLLVNVATTLALCYFRVTTTLSTDAGEIFIYNGLATSIQPIVRHCLKAAKSLCVCWVGLAQKLNISAYFANLFVPNAP